MSLKHCIVGSKERIEENILWSKDYGQGSKDIKIILLIKAHLHVKLERTLSMTF